MATNGTEGFAILGVDGLVSDFATDFGSFLQAKDVVKSSEMIRNRVIILRKY
jgi:hypothetical protein